MSKEKPMKTGEKIFSAIRQRIINWDYPPNFPLGEEALSKEFGVSRSPVREALHMLEAANLVTRVPNRGYFVKQVLKTEITELYDLRLMLELSSADHILQHPELAPEIKKMATPWELALKESHKATGQDLALIDQDFHEGLVALVGNSMLSFYFKNINERLFRFRVMDFEEVLNSGTLKESVSEHLSIIQAFVENDRESVIDSLKNNIAVSRANVDISLGRALLKTYDL